MTDKQTIILWVNFLANHKLVAKEPAHTIVLFDLCCKLADKSTPKCRPHKARLASRRLVCEVAMESCIDLTAIKHKGKIAMARGLLDMWNTVYQERFQSNIGTAGWREVKRRGVKTKLGLERRRDNIQGNPTGPRGGDSTGKPCA